MRRRWRGSTLFTDAEVVGVLRASTLESDNVIDIAGGLQSTDYVATAAGWKIFGNGDVEFNDGTFRGVLAAASGSFSGDISGSTGTFEGDISAATGTFTGAIEASSIDIGGADATSFHVDGDGNLWLGAATYAAAPFKVSNAGAVTATDGTFSGTVDAATYTGGGTLSPGAANSLESDNYVAGTSGWQIDGDGNAEFNDGTFRGDLVAGTIDLGSSSFTVSALGAMVATSATITGSLETGPDDAGFADGSAYSYAYGNTVAGTEWTGPDPVGSGTASKIGLYTDAAFTVTPWYSYIDMSADDIYLKARSSITLEPNVTVTDDLTVATVLTVGLWPSGAFEGLMHSDLSSDYMIMSDGTTTYLGGDGNVYVRPNGNGGGSARFAVSGSGIGVYTGAGSATGPSHSFHSDTDTGMYAAAANQLSFTTGGTRRMVMTSTGVSCFSRMFADSLASSSSTSGEPIWHFNAGGDELYKYTSTGRLKKNQTPRPRVDARTVLDLRPTTFDPQWEFADGTIEDVQVGPRDPKHQGQKYDMVGLIAEDVAVDFPQACIYDEEGNPRNIDWNAITTSLIGVVQDLDERIAALETRGP